MDKVAMYKEEIMEKVALNASKARAMAKEVGLIADGNWKWALRNLRNGKGELLKGKELADTKAKLGDLSNNAYQKVKSISRKLPSKTEIGGIINKGNLEDTAIGELRQGSSPSKIKGQISNMHTHPYNPGENRFGTISNTLKLIRHGGKKDIEVRNAIKESLKRFAPSGIKDIHNVKRNHLNSDLSGGLSRFKNSSGNNDNIQKLKNLESKVDKANKAYDKAFNISMSRYMENKGDDLSKVKIRAAEKFSNKKYNNFNKATDRLEHFKKTTYPTLNGDVDAILKTTKGEHHIERVVSPNQDFVGIHKVSPYKKRSIFFDKTPRKER
jgi:hypothetical protein